MGKSRRKASQHEPVQQVSPPETAANSQGIMAQNLAAEGLAETGDTLPYLDALESAFGGRALGGVPVAASAGADRAASDMGANAFAMDGAIALGSGADLHTVAHEAAHLFQNTSGVSRAGDANETQANAIADRVVAGESAADLMTGLEMVPTQSSGLSLDTGTPEVADQGESETSTDESDAHSGLKTSLDNGSSITGKIPIQWELPIGDAVVSVTSDVTLALGPEAGFTGQSLKISIKPGEGTQDEGEWGTEVELGLSDSVSLKKLGLDLPGGIKTALDSEKKTGSIAKEGTGWGVGFAYDGSREDPRYFLTGKVDPIHLLYGEAIKEVQKDLKSKGVDFKLKLEMNGEFEIIDGHPPAMRLEKASAELGGSIGVNVDDKENGYGVFGVEASAGVSIETDFADGSKDDKFSETKGSAHAGVTITLFGEKFSLKMEETATQKGRLWENYDVQLELLEMALEGAYGELYRRHSGDTKLDAEELVTDLHHLVDTGWDIAAEQIAATQGVDLSKSKQNISTWFYERRGHNWAVANYGDMVSRVTAKDPNFMQLHETITWTGGVEVDGDYIADGVWSGDVFLGVAGERLIGDYDGELGSGSLQGTVKGQVITGTWYGNDGSQGSFALQIQDEGNHLFGRWDMDDDNWRDWSLKRA